MTLAWIERMPRRTRKNDGLGTGSMMGDDYVREISVTSHFNFFERRAGLASAGFNIALFLFFVFFFARRGTSRRRMASRCSFFVPGSPHVIIRFRPGALT